MIQFNTFGGQQNDPESVLGRILANPEYVRGMPFTARQIESEPQELEPLVQSGRLTQVGNYYRMIKPL